GPARMQDVVVLTMSEFGRTVRQNGTGGTDHGHANAMFVVGGSVRGGRVYGRWPGLRDDQLLEGRDLALTTDFRDVFGQSVAARGAGVVEDLLDAEAGDRRRRGIRRGHRRGLTAGVRVHVARAVRVPGVHVPAVCAPVVSVADVRVGGGVGRGRGVGVCRGGR